MLLLLLVVTSAMAAQPLPTIEAPCNYFLPGPYEVSTAHDKFKFSDHGKVKATVKVTSTLPVILREGEGRFPTVVLFNGFKVSGSLQVNILLMSTNT